MSARNAVIYARYSCDKQTEQSIEGQLRVINEFAERNADLKKEATIMKIAACYIRVSTDDQLEYSPDSQLEKIRDFAKRNDMLLPEDNIFLEEDGVSGRKAAKRHEFQRMISMAKCKPKPFDVILVWKFSRFARNREDSIVYKSMLRKQLGIEVISVSYYRGNN